MYGLLFDYMKGGKVRPDSRQNVGKDSLHGVSGVNLRGYSPEVKYLLK